MKLLTGIVEEPYPNKPYKAYYYGALLDSFQTYEEAWKRLLESLHPCDPTLNETFLPEARKLKTLVEQMVNAHEVLGIKSDISIRGRELLDKLDFR